MKWKVMCTALIATAVLGTNVSTASANTDLEEMKTYVKNYYYPSLANSSITSSTTVQELSKKLDDYSYFMTAKEYKEFYNSVESKLVGIGVTIEQDALGIKVLGVMNSSPAKASGLKAGDIITHVGKQSLAGMKVEDSSSLLRGEENTKVTITFNRPSTKKSYTKTLTRKVINIPNVETKKLAGNIQYIRLNTFASDSGQEIQKAIKKVSPTAKGYIFDLRDNGGGDVNAAVDIIGLSKKNNYSFYYKSREDEFIFASNPQKVTWNQPLKILVNGNSASASEMTAASYQDQKSATLYGQKTYGKGVMQTVEQLSSGNFFKFTMAEFRGPNGKVIQKKGVTPDVITAKNNEVKVSHKAFLKSQLKKYDQDNTVTAGAKKASFTIKPTKNMDWNTLKKAKISLLQIGGVKRDITVKPKGKTLVVTAKTGMKKGSTYYVRIVNSKNTKDGTYRYVKVK